MNWEAIGAIGQIAGAIAVVATLFYLAMQIRQNSAALDRMNEHAQASSGHDINSLYIHVFSQLAQNQDLAAIYRKALDGSDLDPVEATRFGAFANTFMAWLEDIHYQQQHELGFSGESPSSVMTNTAPYVRQLLETEAGRMWWRAEARGLYSRLFLRAIDSILDQAGDDSRAA